MKRILLGMVILFIPFYFLFGQNTVVIVGETNPKSNQSYNYQITSGFHGVSGTNATWKVTRGKFLDGSTELTQGVDIMNVTVIWTGDTHESGQLTYSYSNGNSSYNGSIGISIKGDFDGGSTEDEIYTSLVGGQLISGNQERFGYKTDLPSYKRIKEWRFDENLFNLTRQLDHTIWLQAKQVTGLTPTFTQITMVAEENTFWGWETIVTYTWGVYIYGTPYIKNIDKSIICSGENIIYDIGNLSLPNIVWQTIEWQAGQNMAIVSGQGTPTATFSASGNGYGTVKAIITYDNGKVFEIENSDVWVGKPKIDGIDIMQNSSVINGDLQYNTFYSLKLKTEEKITESEYRWTLSNSNATILNSGIYDIFKEVGFSTGYVAQNDVKYTMIIVDARNTCGTTTFNRGVWIAGPTGGGLGGGGLNPPGIDPLSLKSSINIDTSSNPVSIRVYNFTTGSVVHQEKNAVDFNIQNTSLKEGIYIIETTDKNGDKTTEKVYKKNQ